jgi:hypothetical protein
VSRSGGERPADARVEGEDAVVEDRRGDVGDRRDSAERFADELDLARVMAVGALGIEGSRIRRCPSSRPAFGSA